MRGTEVESEPTYATKQGVFLVSACPVVYTGFFFGSYLGDRFEADSITSVRKGTPGGSVFAVLKMFAI
ncbi:hypothetical protein GCM10011571_04650 [Marinithermofilum abyssi]|uniref:Uncharacterized protein n=1 Tax=Marinithermofilum abyssi TaxID=1571185 RepID=A0A8J2YA57_9BACL|nr:hypothetical protein GCM10011571_04650 [Marinithermofilum abyssi]